MPVIVRDAVPGDAPGVVNKCVLSDHAGMVCITLERPASGIELTADEARVMGEALLRQAYRAHHGDYPAGRSQSVDMLRARARNRVRQMLRKPIATLEEEEARALAIVDEVFKLVL